MAAVVKLRLCGANSSTMFGRAHGGRLRGPEGHVLHRRPLQLQAVLVGAVDGRVVRLAQRTFEGQFMSERQVLQDGTRTSP
jgi:hypothetical protein